ncbi:deoxyguanosinetriphosphate triphosphohydrolase [Gallibacterium salpingitidis]|uniref:CidB/LrgB family autolysis modulator n=1 Tax=Gallibacterium salpingitidis TaxID=505341 RepID=UPI0008048D24|nr:CidB/LrgB family autolysis modulator [Gallibacterium salpingitidis]OBX04718.1 deoxyguanosinetriphosphate triphosphohydrolase [Gallibacterium salpingitidis]WKT00565.1 CidB/LrgB family autolysis modulator [Gallibacterium salpingitidis]
MIYLYCVMTIVTFSLAVAINERIKSLVFNSFVITVCVLIAILLIFDIPYHDYIAGNKPLSELLGPSIVALAIPLYEQLKQIKQYWRSILFITTISSAVAMMSGALVAFMLGGDQQVMATLFAKSITTPLAMAVSGTIGGVPTITVVLVIIAGLIGSVFGYTIIKLLRIKSSEAAGLAIGTASHALGTAACMEIDKKAGTYSSIALVLCGVITSLIAPLLFDLVLIIVKIF